MTEIHDGSQMSRTKEIELQSKLATQKKLRYSFDFCQYYHQWYNRLILSVLHPSPGARVLDCGCGTGILLSALEDHYKKTIGLDLSYDNLLQARAVNPRSSLVVGDVTEIPLKPQSFDYIICRATLHRLPDALPAFVMLFDILKPGGDLVISEPINDSRIVRLLKVIRNLRAAKSYKHQEFKYSARAWIDLARLTGFQTVKWSNLGYVALPLLGYPDETYLMRYVPSKMLLAKILLHLDEVIGKIPWVKTSSWHALFHFKKPFGQS